MLDRISRGAILALSAACAAGAVALAPPSARSSTESNLPGHAAIAVSAADEVALEPIRRDPFAVPAAPAPPPAAAAADLAPAASAAHGPDVLPGNLGDNAIPAIPGTLPANSPPAAPNWAAGSQVTAVVTGAHPYAMVETAGVHEIKGLGDRIAGSTIVSIDITGIRLQNGARLSVAAGELP